MFFTFINCAILTTLASFVTLCGQQQLNGQLPWSPKYSVCDFCHHPLSWWQLIPILGFIIQRGRCHWCETQISAFFPLSELMIILVTAKTFTSSWYHNLIFTIVILTLLYLSTTDFVSQVIYPIALIGLLPLLLVLPRHSFSIGKVVVELVIMGFFFFGLQHITKGLGTGDIEFILMTDLIGGWELTAQIVLIGCLLTLIPALIKRNSKLPLISGLALGFIPRLLFCSN